jgi:hypothetical protein
MTESSTYFLIGQGNRMAAVTKRNTEEPRSLEAHGQHRRRFFSVTYFGVVEAHGLFTIEANP